MDLLSTLLLFTLIAACVAVVGVVLASSADKLGEAYQLQRSITGFIILAAATSLPEFVIGYQVARTGAIDMAVGSLLGSCLINLLILAGIDLCRRTQGRILSRTAAAHALSALSSILLATLVIVCVIIPGMPTLGSIHLGTCLLLSAYLLTGRMVFLDQLVSNSPATIDKSPPEIAIIAKPKKWPLVCFIGAAFALLLLSTPLANSSETLATQLRLSGTFFGAVFLALVTSLPEAVTTYEAVRRNADDMAIGNILGSNSFNLLIIAVIDLCTPEPLFSNLSSAHAVAAIGVIITTTIATMGLLYRVENRIWYLEPDAVGVILSALIFFYLVYVL